MRKLLVLLFVLVGFVVNGQTLRQFEGVASIYGSSGTGPVYNIKAFYFDQLGYYSSDSTQVGDVLYVLNGGACARLEVTTINSNSGGLLNLDVTDIDGVMLAPPSGNGGITRETSNKGLPMYMIGISESLRTCVGSHLAVKSDTLDTSQAIIDSTFVRNDSVFIAVGPGEFYSGPTTGSNIGVDSLQYVRDTVSLTPNTGDQFVNSTKDTSGVYASDRWLLSVGGPGSGSVVAQQGATDPIGIVTPTGIGSTYIDTIQNKVYTAYGTSNTEWAKAETISYYNTKSDIAATYHSVGDIIITNGFGALNDGGGAMYRVFADSVSGYVNDGDAVIELASSNYAIIQPTSTGGYRPEWFGAIVDDNLPDSTAFEKTLNWVSTSSITPKIETSSGVYNDPLLRIIKNNDGVGNFDFITVTVEGPLWPYTSTKSIGSSTVFRFSNQLAGIFVQQGRSVNIKNIYFSGTSSAPFANKDSLIAFTEADWARHHSAAKYTPHAGIVIDAFQDDGRDKYSGLEHLYTNTGGGTSMITIENCSFASLDVAVAELGSQNGDNIVIKNSNADNLRRFYVSYCSQSRQGIIENIYAKAIQTFIFNDGAGAMPEIHGVNGAGFIKEIGDLVAIESKLVMHNCIFESLYSIGRWEGNPNHFSQCQFKINSEETIPAAPIILSGGTATTFDGCTINYFANCAVRTPMTFVGNSIEFNGCHIQGGVPWGNRMGSGIHNIRYKNTWLSCYNANISTGETRNLAIGQGVTTGIDGPTEWFYNENDNYTAKISFLNGTVGVLNYIGSVTYDSITPAKGYIIVSDSTERVALNDGLIGVNITQDPYVGNNIVAGMGTVESISKDTIFLIKTVNGLQDGATQGVYTWSPAEPVVLSFGDITTGNDTIKNIFAASANSYGSTTLYGTRVKIPGFKRGTYIVESNIGQSWLRLSSKATASSSKTPIKTVDYTQEVWVNSITGFPAGLTFIEGAMIYNTSSDDDWTHARVKTSGKYVDATNPVVFERFNPSIVDGSETNGHIPIWNSTNKRYEPGINAPAQDDITGVTNPAGGVDELQPTVDSLWSNRHVDTSAYIANENLTLNIVSMKANDFISITSRVNSSSTQDNTITLPAPAASFVNTRVLVYADDLDNSSTDSYDTEISSTNIYSGNNNIGSTYMLAGGETVELVCLLRDGSYIWEILSRRYDKGSFSAFSNTSQTVLTERGDSYVFQSTVAYSSDTLDVSDLEPGDKLNVDFRVDNSSSESIFLTSGTFSWNGDSGLDSLHFVGVDQNVTMIWSGSIMSVYGNEVKRSEYFNSYVDAGSPLVLSYTAASVTPQVVTGTSRASSGFTFSSGVYTYTGTSGAVFNVGHGASASFAESTVDIFGDIYVNGVKIVGTGIQRTIGTSGNMGSASREVLLTLQNGDDIEVRYYPGAHTGDDDLTINQFHFTATKVK